MLILGTIFAVLAALLHCFIFYLESCAWTSARARTVFGMSETEAESTLAMAYNQGFYNLFLAIEVLVGAVLAWTMTGPIGTVLMLAGVGSMLAAAAVLWTKFPDKRAAAVKQGAFPVLAVLALALALF